VISGSIVAELNFRAAGEMQERELRSIVHTCGTTVGRTQTHGRYSRECEMVVEWGSVCVCGWM
jgi:hypothetical protein